MVGAERDARRSESDRVSDAVDFRHRGVAECRRLGGSALSRAASLAAVALGWAAYDAPVVDGCGGRDNGADFRLCARQLSVVAAVLARCRDIYRRVFLGRAVHPLRDSCHRRRAFRVRPGAVRSVRDVRERHGIPRIRGNYSARASRAGARDRVAMDTSRHTHGGAGRRALRGVDTHRVNRDHCDAGSQGVADADGPSTQTRSNGVHRRGGCRGCSLAAANARSAIHGGSCSSAEHG